jgi:signal transduction histidine kinase
VGGLLAEFKPNSLRAGCSIDAVQSPTPRLGADRARWRVIGVGLLLALLAAGEAADLWLEHRNRQRHGAAGAQACLESWNTVVEGVIAPIVGGARSVLASGAMHSADEFDRSGAALQTALTHLARASPVATEWAAIGSQGQWLASAASAPVVTDTAALRDSAGAALARLVAGASRSPVYHLSRDGGVETLNITVPLTTADTTLAGVVFVRAPTQRLHELARDRCGRSDAVVLLLDGRQLLFERRGDETGLGADDLLALSQLARVGSTTAPDAALEMVAQSGRRYRLASVEHAAWGLRAAVAVGAESFLVESWVQWLRRATMAIALAGLLGAAWRHLGRLRAGLARARGRLRRLSRQQQRLLDLMPQPAAITSGEGGRANIGASMAQLLGIQGGRHRHWTWSRVVAAADQTAWQQAFEQVHLTGQAAWLPITVHAAAGPREVVARIAVVGDPPSGVEQALTLVALQLAAAPSPQHQAESSLRELLRLAEAEMWRFGQALHDDIGQHLTGLAFVSNALEQKLRSAGRVEANDAQWLAKLAYESIEKSRSLARGMLPVNSDDPGALAMSLRELCEHASSVFGADCRLVADPRFEGGSVARANHLHHAVKELVANAIKHGHARSVIVRLEALPAGTRVSVENDGADLPANAHRARRGMGLAGVRMRAAHLGGTFTFGAAPGGQGVLALIELPAVPLTPPAADISKERAGGLGTISRPPV